MSKPRVFVPYMLSFPGGVRTVLGHGLPRLTHCDVTYAALALDEADISAFVSLGMRVDRRVGVSGSGALSVRHGVRRMVDLLAAAPRIVRLVFQLRRALSQHDVAYVHGFRELLLVWLALHLLRDRSRPRLVWHCHAFDRTRRARLTAWLARRCDVVIAVSHYIVSVLRDLGVTADRVVCIPNAVVSIPHSALSTLSRDSALLVATAALRRSKGIHTAIEALALLPDHYVLWITGDEHDPVAASYAAELRVRSVQLGVHDRVHLLGFRRDIHTLMQTAFAVVTPSLCEEAFGLTAVEPMLCRTPVVVSDRGALPEVVDGGACGLVFAAGNAQDLAAQVLRLGDKAFRANIVARAAQRAETHYSYDRWAHQVSLTLRSIAQAAPRT
jgi:glycosyltransferase involved in cell wall biosynthesis